MGILCENYSDQQISTIKYIERRISTSAGKLIAGLEEFLDSSICMGSQKKPVMFETQI